MAKLAAAGIPTGACLMPLLPGLCDDPASLENVLRWTADHGGQFILAGGLTLADQQREFFLQILHERFPDLEGLYGRLYPPGSYGPAGAPWPPVARRIRELCAKTGLLDRVPRPIVPGEKRALNKRVVEALANRAYDLELEGVSASEIWAYRKAAWAVEDLEQEIGLLYRTMGVKGLQSIPQVDPALARMIEQLLQDLTAA
jgi:hypothetical protein